MEVWLTALEYHLERSSLDEFLALLARHGMSLPAASYQGGLLVSQGDERQAAWDLFRRRLTLCRDLEIPTLIVAVDVPGPLRAGDIERVHRSVCEAAEEAQRYDVRLALEPQAGSAFGNNLQTVTELVEQVRHPRLGICLDVFHFGIGPSKESDLRGIRAESLFHVQASDLVGVPRELASDQHRVLPGDGDLPSSAIVNYLKDVGYDGWISLEILNPQIWEIPARQLGEIGMACLKQWTSHA